jgi:hypothetical protein
MDGVDGIFCTGSKFTRSYEAKLRDSLGILSVSQPCIVI